VFAREQEGKRKDIERAIRVLQARFNIVRRPARSWSQKVLQKIMQACVILHNVIVKDKGEVAKYPLDLNAIPGTSVALPPEVQARSNDHPCFNAVRHRNATIRAKLIHTQLKK
jgi:hypothetical protein